MQENHLFEYAVIRIVPRVEREEFLNVGVILYCAGESFLQVKFCLNAQRIKNFISDFETGEIEKRLNTFKQICNGDKQAGAIAQLPIASRFRWLTAAKSTVVQTSPVHPGLCCNANEKLEKLFTELVE